MDVKKTILPPLKEVGPTTFYVTNLELEGTKTGLTLGLTKFSFSYMSHTQKIKNELF